MNRQILVSVTLASACMALAVILLNSFSSLHLPSAVYGLIAGFALLTLWLYRSIMRSAARNPRRFVTAVIGSITTKLFASAIFIGIYVYMKCPGKIEVACSLFVIYMVFTIVLVSAVNRDSRSIQGK